MMIFFPTRAAARNHSRATGFKSKIVDNGKTSEAGKRFGCTVSASAPVASRASAPKTVTVVGRGRVERTVAVIVKKSRRVVMA